MKLETIAVHGGFSSDPTTTHRQLNEDELKAAGVPSDMVRLSIGIEHIDDILEDITQALVLSAS